MAADHASDGLSLWGVPGLPEFRPGDDLAGALADALAGALADGDVVVVTSKVLSKVEGRLVQVPTDPDARDTARRALIDRETVRLLATKGRTKIVANPLGIVQAAAGIDASNVAGDEVALLPEDPDALGAPPCAPRCGERARRRRRRRRHRHHGPHLARRPDRRRDRRRRASRWSTPTAARSTRRATSSWSPRSPWPTRSPRPPTWSRASSAACPSPWCAACPRRCGRRRRGVATSCASVDEDLFWLGTDEALARGRREAVPARRSVRAFADTPVDPEAPAPRRSPRASPRPPRTTPARCASCACASPDLRTRLLDAMAEAWRADLRGDGFSPDAIDRRVARGDLLRDRARGRAAVPRPRGRPRLPRRPPGGGRAHDVHRRRRRGGAGACSSRWPPRGSGRAGCPRRSSRRSRARGARPARRLGAPRRRRDRAPGLRAAAPGRARRRRPAGWSDDGHGADAGVHHARGRLDGRRARRRPGGPGPVAGRDARAGVRAPGPAGLPRRPPRRVLALLRARATSRRRRSSSTPRASARC